MQVVLCCRVGICVWAENVWGILRKFISCARYVKDNMNKLLSIEN